jgi:hypothetical protein
MSKRRSRSTNKSASAARSGVVEIPMDLAAAIKQCWPRGVVEEFDTDESYLHETRSQIESELADIPGALLVWQTEEASGAGWEDDEEKDEPLLSQSEWQSYHVFFISPSSEEFRFEDETIGEDPEDGTQNTYPGEGRFGLALSMSLAAPVAVIDASSYSQYEDGSVTLPDPMSALFWDEKTRETISANRYHREWLGQEMFQELEILRQKIISILPRHISVLDESVLNLPVRGLKAGEEVFIGKPVRIRDAFFFRGV